MGAPGATRRGRACAGGLSGSSARTMAGRSAAGSRGVTGGRYACLIECVLRSADRLARFVANVGHRGRRSGAPVRYGVAGPIPNIANQISGTVGSNQLHFATRIAGSVAGSRNAAKSATRRAAGPSAAATVRLGAAGAATDLAVDAKIAIAIQRAVSGVAQVTHGATKRATEIAAEIAAQGTPETAAAQQLRGRRSGDQDRAACG